MAASPAENPGHDQVTLLLGQTCGQGCVDDGWRGNRGHQGGQQVEKDAETGQGGAFVVIRGKFGQQGGKWNPAQGLECVADHEGQRDGGSQGDLVVPGRSPP